MQEREFLLLELFEELIPINGHQSVLARVAREIYAEQPHSLPAAPSAVHRRRLSTPRLYPFPNLIVIDGDVPF